MLAKGLPDDPMVFTMAHELKHHLVDREIPVACCSDRNANQHIEDPCRDLRCGTHLS